jgi:glucosamine-6-phosphate isomerase
MKTIIFENEEFAVRSAELIAGIISSRPYPLLCFPAGETSVTTYNEMVRLHLAGKLSFAKTRIVGLDEWANLGEMSRENCYSFLKRHFFDHIDFKAENFCFFNGETDDLEKECAKTDSFIKQYGPVDLMVLGAGMNGHLGLNEPGTPFDLYSHVVRLDETTKNVGQKYFTGSVNLTAGVTLGIKHILESETVILQLSGEKKSGIARRVVRDEPSTDFPASALKLHPNSILLLDRAAAKDLQN